MRLPLFYVKDRTIITSVVFSFWFDYPESICSTADGSNPLTDETVMDQKDRNAPSNKKTASPEHADTPDPLADFDLSESVGYSAVPRLDIGESTEQDEALLQSLFPTRVVFHQVPTTGRNDAVVQAFVRLEKTALDLRHVPEVRVFVQLRAEFPWLEETISVLDHACMLARRGNGILRLAPLLLVGPTGIGKTSLLRRFCELAEVPYLVISAGGASDSMLLKGANRAWSTAQPGAVIRLIQQTEVANPVIIIDEVDKCGSGNQNGNLIDTLLQLIEPSSAAMWHDEFLLGRADLSGVNYLMTANQSDQLSGPLLSRVRTVRQGFMRSKDLLRALPQAVAQVAQSYGWTAEQIPVMDPHTAQRIVSASTDLRKLYRAAEVWLRIIAEHEVGQDAGRVLH